MRSALQNTNRIYCLPVIKEISTDAIHCSTLTDRVYLLYADRELALACILTVYLNKSTKTTYNA